MFLIAFRDELLKIAEEGVLGKVAAELNEAARENIAPKNFALSSKQSDTGKPAYPIEDKSHAANALARVRQFGDAHEKAEVYKDVARKYPELAARSQVPAVKAKAKEKDSEGLGGAPSTPIAPAPVAQPQAPNPVGG